MLPLSTGYRLTYQILGAIFALVLLSRTPIFLAAAGASGEILFHTILEHWVFILFTAVAVIALVRDARIRARLSITGS